jgi:hypothetical protein
MKRLLFFIFTALTLFARPAHAATEITAVGWITNVPAGLTSNLTVNAGTAVTRYWTNNASATNSLLIQTTNTTAAARSNLMVHLIASPIYTAGVGSPSVTISYNPTNTSALNFTAPDNTNLTITAAGTWMSITYYTNTYADSAAILNRTNAMSARERTNAANAIVNFLAGIGATNSIPELVTALSNYAGRGAFQVMSNKITFTFTNIGGMASNTFIRSGDSTYHAGILSNAVINKATIGSNSVLAWTWITEDTTGWMFGDGYSNIWRVGPNGFPAIVSDGVTAATNTSPYGREVLNYDSMKAFFGWLVATTNHWYSTNWFYNSNQVFTAGLVATNARLHAPVLYNGTNTGSPFISSVDSFPTNTLHLGPGVVVETDGSIGIGTRVRVWDGANGLGLGHDVDNSGEEGFAIGPRTTNAWERGGALGYQAKTWKNDQVMIGSTQQNTTITVPTLEVMYAATLSNSTTAARTTIAGDLAFPRATYSSISSSGGTNDIPLGSNVVLAVVGSPTTAWPIGSISGGNRDGKIAWIVNDTGYNADITSNDGGRPVGDRILTLTGTNTTWPANSWLPVWYDSSAARWRMMMPPLTILTASATNAVSSIGTNGVFILGSGATNIDFVSGVTGYVSGGTVKLGVSTVIPGLATNANQFGASATLTLKAGAFQTNANFWGPGTNNGEFTTLTTSRASNYVSTYLGGGQPGAQEVPLPIRLFTLTNAVTITNVTAATSWITNALWGTNWIAANVLTPGSTVRIRAGGYFTSASSTVTTFGLRSGNGLMLATNILALGTGLVADYIEMEVTMTVRATGASGVAFASGSVTYPATTGGASAITPRRLQSGPSASQTVTIDTTAPLLLDLFISPGATTHGFTLMRCTAELIP